MRAIGTFLLLVASTVIGHAASVWDYNGSSSCYGDNRQAVRRAALSWRQ